MYRYSTRGPARDSNAKNLCALLRAPPCHSLFTSCTFHTPHRSQVHHTADPRVFTYMARASCAPRSSPEFHARALSGRRGLDAADMGAACCGGRGPVVPPRALVVPTGCPARDVLGRVVSRRREGRERRGGARCLHGSLTAWRRWEAHAQVGHARVHLVATVRGTERAERTVLVVVLVSLYLKALQVSTTFQRQT